MLPTRPFRAALSAAQTAHSAVILFEDCGTSCRLIDVKQILVFWLAIVSVFAFSGESIAQSDQIRKFAESLPEFRTLGEPIFHTQEHFKEYYRFLNQEGITRFRLERFQEKDPGPGTNANHRQFFLVVREYASRDEALLALAKTTEVGPEKRLLVPDYSFANKAFLYSLFLLCSFDPPTRDHIERKLNLAVLGEDRPPAYHKWKICESKRETSELAIKKAGIRRLGQR